MPITSNASLVSEVESIQFNVDDTIDVTMSQTFNGVKQGFVSFLIPAAAVIPVLDAQTTPPATIRQTLIGAIYGYLIANNLVTGIAS